MERAVVAATRSFTTVARAEREGRLLCAAVLLVVQGPPGRLGQEPVEDLTAWFYGALEPRFEIELERLAEAARGYTHDPGLEGIDLVVQGPAGELRLEGCRLQLPVRTAGPASTLEYRLWHPGPVPQEQPREVVRGHLRLVA
jgi:hypothetical protein